MGLILTTKGFKLGRKVDLNESQQKLNLFYLDLPMTAKVAYEVGSSKIYGILGPYIGWGLFGKSKSRWYQNGVLMTHSMPVTWGLGSGCDLKRFDYGLTIGAGIESKLIQFNLSYGLGLANIATYTDGGNVVKNRILGVSLGYKLGRKI